MGLERGLQKLDLSIELKADVSSISPLSVLETTAFNFLVVANWGRALLSK